MPRTGPDQADLEASRLREWSSFYQELHRVPEPRTYRDLFCADITVSDGAGLWRGLDDWSAEERAAISIGVRASLAGLTATRDLTVLEIDFHNPPSAMQNCPPSTTFVHRLDHGRSTKLDIYYHEPPIGRPTGTTVTVGPSCRPTGTTVTVGGRTARTGHALRPSDH